MTRNAENPFSLKDMASICVTNPIAGCEFGGLVEQAMTSPVPIQEVTIVDFQREPNLVSGQKTPSASF